MTILYCFVKQLPFQVLQQVVNNIIKSSFDMLKDLLLEKKHSSQLFSKQGQMQNSPVRSSYKDRLSRIYQKISLDRNSEHVQKNRQSQGVYSQRSSSMHLSQGDEQYSFLEGQGDIASSILQRGQKYKRKGPRMSFKKKKNKKNQVRLYSQVRAQQETTSNQNHQVTSKIDPKFVDVPIKWKKNQQQQNKTLNYKIFHLDKNVQSKLYFFNLIVNSIFRLSLISVLILMIVQQKQYSLMVTILILESVAVLFYIIAMVKMLYTKSMEEAVYFQKYFYEVDYADIHMERILRKHFTLGKVLSNITQFFFKPCSKFKRNIRIALFRQQIFKRMELMLCFIPFVLVFFIYPDQFRLQFAYDVEMILTSVICLQFLRCALHYLIIYICS